MIAPGPRMCLLVVSTPGVKDHGPQGDKCECLGYVISQQLQLCLSTKLDIVIALNLPYIYVTHGPPYAKGYEPRCPKFEFQGYALSRLLKQPRDLNWVC